MSCSCKLRHIFGLAAFEKGLCKNEETVSGSEQSLQILLTLSNYSTSHSENNSVTK